MDFEHHYFRSISASACFSYKSYLICLVYVHSYSFVYFINAPNSLSYTYSFFLNIYIIFLHMI